jgi:hypothetical protein
MTDWFAVHMGVDDDRVILSNGRYPPDQSGGERCGDRIMYWRTSPVNSGCEVAPVHADVGHAVDVIDELPLGLVVPEAVVTERAEHVKHCPCRQNGNPG